MAYNRELAMKIRCPNCGRMGYLPDHLVPAANRLRCRKCQAHFMMRELSLQGIEPRLQKRDSWRTTTIDAPVASRSRENPALFLTDGFVASLEEPGIPLRKRGPGDSHYELAFALKDEPSPSGDDWTAADAEVIEPEIASSDEIEAIHQPDGDLPRPNPLSYRFIMSWVRLLCIVSLGFVAVSVILIGFLLLCSLGGSPVFPVATHALVLASLGTVAFLLFGLWMVFLSVVLAELAESLRRSGDSLDRGWRR
jgi:hypothetical protein